MIEIKTITTENNGVHDITDLVLETVADSGVTDGVVTVESLCPGAGILILPACDEALKEDVIAEIRKLIPSRITFKHQESPDGTASWLKSALFGMSESLVLKDGRLVSGGKRCFLCDHDGPRNREICICVIADK